MLANNNFLMQTVDPLHSINMLNICAYLQQVEHLKGGVPWQVLVHLGVPEGWQGEHQLLQHPLHLLIYNLIK